MADLLLINEERNASGGCISGAALFRNFERRMDMERSLGLVTGGNIKNVILWSASSRNLSSFGASLPAATNSQEGSSPSSISLALLSALPDYTAPMSFQTRPNSCSKLKGCPPEIFSISCEYAVWRPSQRLTACFVFSQLLFLSCHKGKHPARFEAPTHSAH